MKKNKYPWCKQTFSKATILTLSIHVCRKITLGKLLALIWNQLVMPRVSFSDAGKPLSLFHTGGNCIQKLDCGASFGAASAYGLNCKQFRRTEVGGEDKVLTLQHWSSGWCRGPSLALGFLSPSSTLSKASPSSRFQDLSESELSSLQISLALY